MAKKKRYKVKVSELMEMNKNISKFNNELNSTETNNKEEIKNKNQQSVVSKERIKSILDELDRTGVLTRLNGENHTINALSNRQQNQIKDLKSTAEFIKTVQHTVSSNNNEELTIDSLIQRVNNIKEGIQKQAIERFNSKSSREE